jgi:hypothetical protein
MYISSLCYYFFKFILKKEIEPWKKNFTVSSLINFNNYFVSCVHYILFRNRSNFTGSNLPIVIITTDNDPSTNLPLEL